MGSCTPLQAMVTWADHPHNWHLTKDSLCIRPASHSISPPVMSCIQELFELVLTEKKLTNFDCEIWSWQLSH